MSTNSNLHRPEIPLGVYVVQTNPSSGRPMYYNANNQRYIYSSEKGFWVVSFRLHDQNNTLLFTVDTSSKKQNESDNKPYVFQVSKVPPNDDSNSLNFNVIHQFINRITDFDLVNWDCYDKDDPSNLGYNR